MGSRPQLQAPAFGAIVKRTVRAVVAGYRLPQVVRSPRVFRFLRLMALIDGAGHVLIQEPWCHLVSENCLHGWNPHVEFPAVVVRRPHDGSGRDFGLINCSDRLRFVRHAVPDPLELRRVEPRQLDDREPHATPIVQQLATH
jgi:hypothetical protein